MEWELHKLIGSGSFGNVHLVKNTLTGRFGALKTSQCFEESNFVLGTLRELFFYSSFAPSPGVCSSLGHWKRGDKAYFLMPLYPCTMEAVYTQFSNSLPFNDFVRILSHIVVGLEAMHTQGFLHRDIKPENILLSSSGACLADFNLMRWAAVQKQTGKPPTKWWNLYSNSTEPHSVSDFGHVLKENASTYVCTLWTRAPELVQGMLQKKTRIAYGEEIDMFSLGCTMLALAAGDFILGKKCSLPKKEEEDPLKNTTEYRYLAGFLKTFGMSEEIKSRYKDFTSELHWDDASSVVYTHVNTQILWNTDQILSVSNLIAGLLHPLPERRFTLDKVKKWLEAHPVKPNFSEALTGFMMRKEEKLIRGKQSPISIRLDQVIPTIPALLDFDPLTFWTMCSHNFIPPYIACEVLRIKRSLPLSLHFSKALLYLLDCVHDFQRKENYKLFSGIDPEHVYTLACTLKPQHSTLDLSLSLLGSPFLVCCLAAEIYVTGQCANAEDLKKSKTMYLSNVKPFFEAYGNSWKSQTSMRQTWSRL
jgi:serine/threonine protein kinase